VGDIACDVCGGWYSCTCNNYDDDYDEPTYRRQPSSPPVRDWASRIEDMQFSDKTNRVIVDVVELATVVKDDLKNAFRKFFR